VNDFGKADRDKELALSFRLEHHRHSSVALGDLLTSESRLVSRGAIVEEAPMGNKDSEIEIEFDRMTDEEYRDIRAEIEAVLETLRADNSSELSDLGISPETARSIAPDNFGIEKGQQLTGLEVALVLIVAHSTAKVSTKVILDVWKGLVFPRLKSRYGQRIRSKAKH
jgi:hypothetical protein